MGRPPKINNPDLAKFIGNLNPDAPPAPAAGPTAPPAPRGSMAPREAFMPTEPTPVPPAPNDTPTEQILDDIQKSLEQSPEDRLAKYWKELDALGVTRDEAAKVIDQLLFKGVYQEEYRVNNKLTVTFRTRDQRASDRLAEAMDQHDPKFNGTLLNLVAQYNLAASLVQYGPHKFEGGTTEEGFTIALDYIKKLPFPVFSILATKLSKFDTKVATIMTEEAVSSFF